MSVSRKKKKKKKKKISSWPLLQVLGLGFTIYNMQNLLPSYIKLGFLIMNCVH